MLEEEINHSSETVRDGWTHSILRLLEVLDSPKCNKGAIDWYIRMPTDPHPVNPKAGKLHGQCKKEDATLGPAFPVIKVSFCIEIGRNVHWNKSNTVLVGQIQEAVGYPGKKSRYYYHLQR